jgi:hypothetical protein
VDFKEFLEDITVILHNMAFNRFISEEDVDPEYNRHPYRVDWNGQIEKQASYQEDHREDLFDINYCKNNIYPFTKPKP